MGDLSRSPELSSRQAAPMSERRPAWELVDIVKRFPGVVANDDVSLKLYPGEIHGLLGENGSGKSTLIKVLSGAHQPDAGAILRRGEPIALTSPIKAREAGVSTVFQEFSVVPTLTVAENIHLGRWPKRGMGIDWPRMREEARRILADMNVEIDPDRVVSTLSVAEQQLVEIAKALASDATMLILDEPTTALGRGEIARLHALLRRLRERGAAILYVSHRLDEVVELVDVVTIMKDGKVASPAERSKVEILFIVETMVGAVGEHYPKERSAVGDVILAARGLSTANRVRDVSFEVRRGEVFGLGGVLGSGRTELARALFGVDRLTAGEIVWKGRATTFRSPKDAVAAGLALVPENRKFDGLFFNFAGFPNITAAGLDRLGRYGLIDLAKEAEHGRSLVKDLDITPAAEFKEVGSLSGGNQQKVVVARWLFAGADLFILDEPTQGIDIGAKIAVYRLINRLTASGKAVILISSDHDELIAMSDRIGLMSHGRLVAVREARGMAKTDLVQASAVATEAAA
jgi:ribose transport system ATP-binding protein